MNIIPPGAPTKVGIIKGELFGLRLPGLTARCNYLVIPRVENASVAHGFQSFYSERHFVRSFSIECGPNQGPVSVEGMLNHRTMGRVLASRAVLRAGTNQYGLVTGESAIYCERTFRSDLALWSFLEADLTGTARWRQHTNDVSDIVTFGEERQVSCPLPLNDALELARNHPPYRAPTLQPSLTR